MGIGNIIQKHTRKGFQFMWKRVQLVSIPDIPVQTSKYNQSFVNFSVLVGVISLAIYAVKNIRIPKKSKPLSRDQLQTKYGKQSWALISDVRYCQDYVKYLSKNGFNLILMGQAQYIRHAIKIAQQTNPNIKIVSYDINWYQQSNILSTYQDIEKFVTKYDLSVLVVPKLQFSNQEYSQSNYSENVRFPPIESGIMLSRFLGSKMSWRSYQSLIIFPSSYKKSDIQKGQGIIQGSQQAYENFAINLSEELRMERLCPVIVAKGNVQNAFTYAEQYNVSN